MSLTCQPELARLRCSILRYSLWPFDQRYHPDGFVFVIDRRIVVDQVFERAQRIRKRIGIADSPVLKMIQERLRRLSDGDPLGVVALQGGVPIDNEWAGRPDQPWVMVSTVDQFGSRLLFRGYGVGWRMRPIHAGLAGNDCLVILDEVHLSVPFAETLDQVSTLRSGRVPRRYGIVEMSATPSRTSANTFMLDPSADLDGCVELCRRVRAEKKAELVSVRDPGSIPSEVLKRVKSLAQTQSDDRVRSIGVVVNRVRTARETHHALKGAGFPVNLLTGRMRPLDRADLLKAIAADIDPDVDSDSDSLTILVSTQAIEVGADFSFDALITECSSVDSLRQRFGRLDRRGSSVSRTGVPARAWILGPKSVVASRKPDPIYGHSVRSTWNELERQKDVNGQIDVGPLFLRDFPAEASAPRASAPLLLTSHMDAWVQTQPEPVVQPSLEWFLHGIEREQATQPDVSIVWRWDSSRATLTLVPPRKAEHLQVPIGAAKSWLSGGSEIDIADVDSHGHHDDRSVRPGTKPLADCVRWEGFAKAPQSIRVNEIRPGDILIVAPDRGGVSAGTWDPSSAETVRDLGDAAQMAYGRRATLRLDHRLYASCKMPLPLDESEADSPTRDRIIASLRQWKSDSEWVSRAISKLGESFEITPVSLDDQNPSSGYYILTERNAVTGTPAIESSTNDGSDEAGAFIGTGESLHRHLECVGTRAMRIAQRLGCSTELAEDLRLAGRLHDLGKVDSRFQDQLVGGDPVVLERLDQPLAKSLPGAPRVWRYPKGMRHEVASLAMIESNPDVLSSAHDRDLVLHLVGTHHGWGRPLLAIVHDPKPQTLTYMVDGRDMNVDSGLAGSRLALDMADRFWRLVGSYGYYGLAWLEAVLRLADHQESAEGGAKL